MKASTETDHPLQQAQGAPVLQAIPSRQLGGC